jgi:archaemetzincin
MRPPPDPARLPGIDLLPLGPLPDAAEIAAALSRRVSVPCRALGKLDLPMPPLDGRDQADADGLLARIEEFKSRDGAAVVGLTARDLGTPVFAWVFGRARRGGRAAVVSLARLDPRFYGLPPDGPLTLRRAVAEVLHELGHVAGLAHCPDPGCVMRFAALVEAADLRGDRPCRDCAARLPFLRVPASRD